MAAGMGSRFGGLKQIEPVGPSGEIIADYSVYDAIRTGFTNVVFIIRKENLDYFKNNITNKFDDKIKVDFAFQELDVLVPDDVSIPREREKMLGTGHAVLSAKDKIRGNFIIINGDDFYGYDAFDKAANYFKYESKENEYLTVNYPIKATMSKNGAVKRGVCFSKDGYVDETIECEIKEDAGLFIARALKDNREFEIDESTDVSMNFIGFREDFLDLLYEKFDQFIHGEITLKNEFLIPDVLGELIKEGRIRGKVKLSTSNWMGITYREDVLEFKEKINKLIDDGEYPRNLWN